MDNGQLVRVIHKKYLSLERCTIVQYGTFFFIDKNPSFKENNE